MNKDKVMAMIRKRSAESGVSVNTLLLTYSKGFVPGGLAYENNTLKQFDQLCEIARNTKPGMLDLDKAEIPGYTWSLTEAESI